MQKRQGSLSEFTDFIPASDSVLIRGKLITDEFFYQLARYIYKTYDWYACNFTNPKDPKDPTKVEVKSIQRNGDYTETEIWFPYLS